MKPSWKNAPEWAEYLAQDYKDGKWYWYSIKPYRCSVKDFVWCYVPDSKYKLAGISDPHSSWKETLERRPNDMIESTLKACRNCLHRKETFDDNGQIIPLDAITDVVCTKGHTVADPDCLCNMYTYKYGKPQEKEDMARVKKINEEHKLDVTPTEYEIHDGTELLAKLSMFDEESATVEIKTVINPRLWKDLNVAIQEALAGMFKE